MHHEAAGGCTVHTTLLKMPSGRRGITPMRCPSAQAETGKLVMAGAYGETPEGALFIFKDATPEVRQWGHAEAAANEPLVFVRSCPMCGRAMRDGATD